MPDLEDPSVPTRLSLLERLKSWDDQEGWREFFDSYWRLIYSFARKTGLNDAECQDIVQDTLIAVAGKMPGFNYDPQRGSFKNWLLLNVRSRISDHFRKTRRERQSRVDPSLEADDSNSSAANAWEPLVHDLESVWAKEWEENLIATAARRVKAKVSSRQFLIYDLLVIKGEPLSAIRRSLRTSIGQIYLAKHRVGKLMRSELQRLRSIE